MRRVLPLLLLGASFTLSIAAIGCGGTSDPGIGGNGGNAGSGSGTGDDGSNSSGSGTTGGSTGGSGTGSGSSSGGGGSGTTGSGGSGGGGSGSTGTQKGPIRVRNVSYTRPSANHLTVTFSVENAGSAPIEQVDLMNVGLGGTAIDFRFDACPASTPSYAWSLYPGEHSGIFTVDLVANGGAQATYPCAYYDTNAEASSASTWASMNGTVTLTFKGILSDASPWVAVGQGDER